MKRDTFLNLATGTLAACAVVVTVLVARRELGAGSAAPPRVTVERAWREYAVRGPRMGPADAPVTLVEFSDFQCPYCRVLSARLAVLRQRYPRELAVVYRHDPLPAHEHAVDAARASECAAAQGRFAAFHDTLFAAQEQIGRRSWADFARAAGLADAAKIERCMAAPDARAAVDLDTDAAHRLGVRGTPTLLLNELRMQGAPPLDTLDHYVRIALAAQRARTARLRVTR